MNTDERRAFKKFESENSIELDPERWERVKQDFIRQRKGRFGKVEEIIKELEDYLYERGVSYENAEA